MKRYWRYISGLLALLLIIYFIWFAASSLDLAQLREAVTIPVFFSIAGAALTYAMIYPLTGWAWSRLLQRQGEPRPPLELAQIIGLTQLAKYVPGNIAQHATRAALSLRRGIPVRTLIVTVGQETIFAVAASLLVGLALLSATSHAPPLQTLPGYRWIYISATIVSLVACLAACLDIKATSLEKSSHRLVRILAYSGGLPGPSTALPALLVYATNYLLVGFGIWLIACALGIGDRVDYPLAVSAFALSWFLGFLAPGAPAGLGAREATMLLILQGSTDDGLVVLLVILARVATMAGDLLTFLASLLYGILVGKRIEDENPA